MNRCILIYFRDSESGDIPLPPKPTHTRERSLTKPPSPRLLRHAMSMTPTDGPHLRNSWPESGNLEEAPPLPPRSHSKLNIWCYAQMRYNPSKEENKIIK